MSDGINIPEGVTVSDIDMVERHIVFPACKVEEVHALWLPKDGWVLAHSCPAGNDNGDPLRRIVVRREKHE